MNIFPYLVGFLPLIFSIKKYRNIIFLSYIAWLENIIFYWIFTKRYDRYIFKIDNKKEGPALYHHITLNLLDDFSFIVLAFFTILFFITMSRIGCFLIIFINFLMIIITSLINISMLQHVFEATT